MSVNVLPSAATDTGVPPHEQACSHCGLPAPVSHSGPAFCCDGCRGAYAVIHEWQLEDFYALRDQLGGQSNRPREANAEFSQLDHLELLDDAMEELPGGLSCVRLRVDGLHCGACAWLIERSPSLVNGWDSARVNLTRRTVDVVFAPASTRLSKIAQTLSTFGYQLRPLPEDHATSDGDPGRSERLKRIAVAGFCFANAMWIAIALYAGEDGSIATNHADYLRVFGVVLAAVSVLGPGRVFLRSAAASIVTRTPHIDLPVSLGLTGGFVGSVIALVANVGEAYFDSLCGLVFFLLLGRELQTRMQQRASAAVSALAALSPPTARRVENGTTRVVRATDLEPSDLIEVLPQSVIPADGTVFRGRSHLDQSLLTGESVPVPIDRGCDVVAGAKNLESTLQIRVRTAGAGTRVAALSRLVDESLSTRTPMVDRADRIAGSFVLAIIVAAVATFISSVFTRTPLEATQRAIALLVVACPCALALATPLAIGAALGRLARRGVLIRRGDVFEALNRPGTVFFDKTGTLTTGQLRLIEWRGNDHWLAVAAAVEANSSHPVARCLRDAASDRQLPVSTASDIRCSGQGVCGVIDHQAVHVGTQAYLTRSGVAVPPIDRIRAEMLALQGCTPHFVAVDGEIVASFGVGDTLRDDAHVVVKAFRDRGWAVRILSGDNRQVVESIATQLQTPGLQAFGELTPEEKLDHVQTARNSDQTVVFVGDGVNDSPALAAADVGIATSGAAEASLQAAAVYCPDSLDDVARLLPEANATVAAVRRLLAVSLTYNVAAGVLAIGGWVTPLAAAVLMPVSSLTVTLLALAAARTDRTCP